MNRDVDAIVVFGGTNDFGHGDAPMGEIDSEDIYTFCGGLNSLIKTFKKDFAGVQIVFMTPLHRSMEEFSGRRLKDYVEAIKEVAEYYAIPLLDLYATSGLQPQVPIIMQKYCPDGLHPNDAGHERLYWRMRAFLEAL